ncbi:Sensor protein ZraS [Candidatus Brocadiaceae bacterium B188]|nr:hypothetical protein [Candidatus Brocadia sapporoensis]QQR65816.1 MAG: hypothetical protein IPI25_09615 [Candidatus Brocadia sp.]RZV59685.1 MAG: hypothetical protein EX330_00465 [Candidatus Brocadia sp. BROELEC01]TWU50146.1 Sensor protein ZraS [Candidatus Brocadiaceae bacterium B188]
MTYFHKIFHPEKFNLLLYYTITSFVAIAAMSLLVGWIFPRMESKELIDRSEKYAHQFISHLNYKIYKDFLLPTLRRDKHIDLENNKNQFKKLDRIIRENLYGLHIKKLYLYDFEGHIIYSTIPEHIGFTLNLGVNKNLDSAINGKPASVLRLAGTTDSKGIDVVETLLESYYPFYDMEKNGRKKNQIGVLEIYQDMADLKKQITKAREKAIVMTGSAMGILFLALLLIVFKAARIINTKTHQLIDSKNNLEQKVEERTYEIREAYKKLQLTQRKLIQNEKLASIGTLTAGLAHEINNPLASIASCADGLIERLKTTLGQKEQANYTEEADLEVFPEYLKIICDETYRCKSIISDLLNFSRHSAPIFEKIDINQVIHDTLSVGQYQRKDQKIQLHLSHEVCEVIGDPQQLRQVFLNLLINSFHATEESGGDILISTIKKQLVVQIIFQDSGIGIKREHLDKIFDPFFTTKPIGKGTGLGLAICYGIIDVHNGRIEAFSEGPGTGATFTVSLPKAT